MTDSTNTTEAMRGQSLRARVEARKEELEDALEALAEDDRARPDIEHALSEVSGLLTGDLDNIPGVVAAELSTWLEANRYVNEWHYPSETPAPVLPVKAPDFPSSPQR